MKSDNGVKEKWSYSYSLKIILAILHVWEQHSSDVPLHSKVWWYNVVILGEENVKNRECWAFKGIEKTVFIWIYIKTITFYLTIYMYNCLNFKILISS